MNPQLLITHEKLWITRVFYELIISVKSKKYKKIKVIHKCGFLLFLKANLLDNEDKSKYNRS